MSQGYDFYMNYDAVEDMQKSFTTAAGKLEEVCTAAEKIAKAMEGPDGALLGEAGREFTDAIREVLVNKIKQLREKFTEDAADLQAAVAKQRDGVETNRRRFI